MVTRATLNTVSQINACATLKQEEDRYHDSQEKNNPNMQITETLKLHIPNKCSNNHKDHSMFLQ